VLDQREAEELFKIIGAKITYYRRLKGVRQIDLAMETGISEQYLSRIEHGENLKGLVSMFWLLLQRLWTLSWRILLIKLKAGEIFVLRLKTGQL